jgi:polar amino acid transport system substrate-binding protein
MDGEEPYLAILLDYPDSAAPLSSVPVGTAPTGGDGIAFIGFGNYAKAMLYPAVRKAAGASLRLVATATGISAHAAAEKYGFARAATDPEEAFGDPDVGTIFIATRHDSHAELAIRALESGKHVFVEKPLALGHDELGRVMKAARAAPGLLTVGFNRRFSPMIREARAALAGRNAPLLMSYRVNAGPLPRDSWVHGAQGGGRILGEACHFVDTLSALAGTPPVAVESMAPGGAGDSIAGLVRFADGSVGTILYSAAGDSAVPKERIEIFAPGVVVEIDDFSAIAISRGGRTKRRKAAQDKGQAEMVRAFLDGRRSGELPIDLDTLEAVSAATLALAGHGA